MSRNRLRRKILNQYSTTTTIILCVILAVFMLFQYFGRQETEEPQTPIEDGATMSVHFLDVGQGDSAFIESEDGNILIDAGTRSASEYICAYLDQRNIKRIDYVILTHPHEDHIGSAANVIERYDIGTVIMPNATATSRVFEKLMDALEAKPEIDVEEGKAGKSYTLGSIGIRLFAPNSDTYDETNNYSIVSKITFGDVSFLFTGDAEEDVEEEILARFHQDDLSATVLKLGHHGSSTSSTDAFLDAVSPKVAIASCGKNNSYGHPHAEVLKRLQLRSVTVYRTDEMGTVVIETDGKNIVKK